MELGWLGCTVVRVSLDKMRLQARRGRGGINQYMCSPAASGQTAAVLPGTVGARAAKAGSASRPDRFKEFQAKWVQAPPSAEALEACRVWFKPGAAVAPAAAADGPEGGGVRASTGTLRASVASRGTSGDSAARDSAWSVTSIGAATSP